MTAMAGWITSHLWLPGTITVDIANRVAREMVVPPHRDGGQAQFIETPILPRDTPADHLSATMVWA